MSYTQRGTWICLEGPGEIWRGELPAHLNLAKFLSNSCFSRWKSWMYFIWGHKATAEVERDVSSRGQAGRYIPTNLAGHPTTPRGTHGLPSPRNGAAEGFQPAGGSAAGHLSSLCQQPWERAQQDFVSWTLPGHPRVKAGPPSKPCPGSAISRWADVCSQHLPEPVPVSLARTGRHSGACAKTPLNTDPPNGKATTQVRREETDNGQTQPASAPRILGSHPGNQDRKSQGSLTGLTGLNKHMASPIESWIKPLPGRA